MYLDLLEIENRRRKIKRILIYLVVAIFTVTISISVGIFCVNYLKDKMSKKEEHILSKAYVAPIITFKKTIPDPVENIVEKVKNIYKSETKRVFLTFDDGPSKSVTPLILDVLKEQNVKATFFLLGSRVELSPEIVKREYKEGHYLANHGYSHIYSQIYTSVDTVLDEYNKTENAIKNAIGNPNYLSNLFRFPGGARGGKYSNVKAESIQTLDDNGIAHIDWSALTGDAAGKKTKEDMLNYVKETIGTRNTVIILMHDSSDKILTYEILNELINYLRENGYEFNNFYDL